MKKIIVILIGFTLFACNNNYNDERETENLITKKIEINYTVYGNWKTITYFQNEKPDIDSTFYFDTNSSEIYSGKRKWMYNENGLVKKIIDTYLQNESITEISYDDQLRISSINHNNSYHSSFEYNNLQVTKNYLGLEIYEYTLDENQHIISETTPNGTTINAQYLDNNLIELGNTQISTDNFNYLDFFEIPLFMKHLEFGENPTNYILFNGLRRHVLLNIGDKFINEVTNENAAWNDLSYTYEFNENSLPIYIREENIDANYKETYFEYE